MQDEVMCWMLCCPQSQVPCNSTINLCQTCLALQAVDRLQRAEQMCIENSAMRTALQSRGTPLIRPSGWAWGRSGHCQRGPARRHPSAPCAHLQHCTAVQAAPWKDHRQQRSSDRTGNQGRTSFKVMCGTVPTTVPHNSLASMDSEGMKRAWAAYPEGELAQDDVRGDLALGLAGVAFVVHVHHIHLVHAALHHTRHDVARLHALIVRNVPKHKATLLVPAHSLSVQRPMFSSVPLCGGNSVAKSKRQPVRLPLEK